MVKALPALAPAVYIPGLLYEALVRARNGLYAVALLPQRRLPAPVISIGNITMGGTGKTPLVICVAQLISNFGRTPAVLTRGYGRRQPGELHILRPCEPVPSPAMTLGDEPALIRRHIPSAWMGISKNRYLAGSILSKRDDKMVFVLDDGLQHRKLQRDLDIAIIDGSQPFKSNRVFPRGTLREPLSGLHRCDIIVINDSADPAENDAVEKEIRDLGARANIFRCRQWIQHLIPFSIWASRDLEHPGRMPAETAAVPETAFLVAAVGNPERLRMDVRQLGISIRGARFFADHYRLDEKDWQQCGDEARRFGAETMITTEKDAVKIDVPPDFPLLITIQSTKISDPDGFATVLKRSIEARL
jgi:tetraacyldisaccharide 4'-kinase